MPCRAAPRSICFAVQGTPYAHQAAEGVECNNVARCLTRPLYIGADGDVVLQSCVPCLLLERHWVEAFEWEGN